MEKTVQKVLVVVGLAITALFVVSIICEAGSVARGFEPIEAALLRSIVTHAFLEDVFGPRKVQHWAYTERCPKQDRFYNRPSLFDPEEVNNAEDCNVACDTNGLRVHSVRRNNQSRAEHNCSVLCHVLDSNGALGSKICDGVDHEEGCLSGESASKVQSVTCLLCDFDLCRPCHKRYKREKLVQLNQNSGMSN